MGKNIIDESFNKSWINSYEHKNKQTLKLLLVVTLLVSLTGAAQVANVYICTGRYAKVYHSNKNCKGLDNCKGEVKLVSLETAKQQGKRACKLCYKK